MAGFWGQSDVNLEVEGLSELLRDAYLVGVDVKDLRRVTTAQGQKIADLAKAKASASFVTPARRRSGRMLTGIKAKRSRVSATIVTNPRIVYTARHHWGLDGKSGPRWAEKARDELAPAVIKAITGEVNRLMANRNL